MTDDCEKSNADGGSDKKAGDVTSALAIDVVGLKKTYQGGGGAPAKEALKGIDLKIRRGSIFGLLGPNGAGKSTTINILAGLVKKSAGRAEVWGFDIDENPRNAKACIGIVPQEIYFDAYFTPREMLEQQAGYYGVARKDRRTDELLELLHLSDKADAYARSLSGGMKRRLLVGKAMVHNPPILVLDEPTAGVDIQLRQQLWNNVRKLNEQGVTIILTTHYLEEAEELCDEIAIINHGEVVACDSTSNLLQQMDEKIIRIRPMEPIGELPATLQTLGAEINDELGVTIRYRPSERELGHILQQVSQSGIGIADLSTEESDLEDIFLHLTGNE